MSEPSDEALAFVDDYAISDRYEAARALDAFAASIKAERDEWQKRAQKAELGWARARLALKAIAQMPGTLRPDEIARVALSDEESP